MAQVRIRQPFLASFAVLALISAYLGLSTQKIPQYGQSDKGLHFITFFLLTLTFYWIFETSRRRCIHITLLTCTAGLSIGSEIGQALLPNGRDFDPYDIVANVLGSGLALALSSWYHKRMLERRRKNKHYDIVPGDEPADGEDNDVELGNVRNQETGNVSANVDRQADGGAQTQAQAQTNVTEELDHWDENEEDWDDGGTPKPEDRPRTPLEDGADTKKRSE